MDLFVKFFFYCAIFSINSQRQIHFQQEKQKVYMSQLTKNQIEGMQALFLQRTNDKKLIRLLNNQK